MHDRDQRGTGRLQHPGSSIGRSRGFAPAYFGAFFFAGGRSGMIVWISASLIPSFL